MLNLDTDHDLGLGIDECNPDWDRRMGVPMAREPAFPIYRKISSTHVFDEFTPGEYEPGRMFCTQYYDEEGYIDDKIEDFLTERDVIYVPLYEHLDRGESKGHIAMGAGTSNRLQSYNHNLAFLKRVAPHVRYIMVGNALCELSFKNVPWMMPDLDRTVAVDLAIPFVLETADLIGSAGGRPSYGTVDWDICIDCYFAKGRLLKTMNSVGAMQTVFCAYNLIYGQVPSTNDITFWPLCPYREEPPWTVLSSYIRGGEFWAGVDSIDGLLNRNDIALAQMGFKAGLFGGV